MNAAPYIVAGRPGHADTIVGNLRAADFDELFAATGMDPDDVLLESWRKSDRRWSIIRRREVIGVFGLIPLTLLGKIGVPWLLGTNALDDIKVSIVKQARGVVDYMLSLYPVLANFTDVEHYQSHRLLGYLGFRIDLEPRSHGPFRHQFYYFEKKR